MSGESEVLTLVIRLSGWRGDGYEWQRTIEILAGTSLHDLHCTIQDIVGFDDDHMYTFYVGRNWRKRDTELAEAAAPSNASDYEGLPLSRVFPLENQCKLYYWFDFGDDWIFEIRPRAGRKVRNARAKYPRVIEKRGRNPRQYARWG
jgi:hypothetical protein